MENFNQEDQNTVSDLYRPKMRNQWSGSKTMEHASGIWGREPMLSYLKEKIVQPGDTVVDLGSGTGYPTIKIAEMVGETGQVIGIEKSTSMLGLEEGQTPLTEKYKSVKNVQFINADITQIPLENESTDITTSFMVIHNLELPDIRSTLKEVARIVKPGGKSVFLTIHPEALDQPWELDFMRYDEDAIKKFKNAENKEGIFIKGTVKSTGGGEKEIAMFTHTRENIDQAIEDAGLVLTDEKDLWMDEKTAKKKFGENSVKQIPTTPMFWIITLEKPEKS